MTRNNKNYRWCTSWNYGNGVWGFQCNDVHGDLKDKQGNKSSICFSSPDTNAIIYSSYLMTTSEEESNKEEEKCEGDSQDNDIISLSRF